MTPKAKRGRPRKYTSNIRKKLALLVTSANNSLRAAGKSYAIAVDDMSRQASHNVTTSCLIELGLVIYQYSCEKLAKSSDLLMMVDGSGTGTGQRSFLLVHFGGTYENKTWSAPFGLLEINDKGAEVDCAAIQSVLESVRCVQREKLNIQPTSILHFKSITFDNCEENTGRWNGLGARLERWRTAEHKKVDEPKPYKALLMKGCSDHIANIVSKSFEKAIVQVVKQTGQESYLSGVKKDRHVATTCIINIYSK